MSDISKEEMVFLLKDVIKLQLANESVIDIHSSKSARTFIIVLGNLTIFGFLAKIKISTKIYGFMIKNPEKTRKF